MLTPYIWASDTSSSMKIRDRTIDGSLDFDDLVDELDVGGQVHFEGRRERFGFFLDATYLKVTDSETQAPILPFENDLRLKTEMETLIGEIGGSYRLAGDSLFNSIDLLLGVRVIDLSLDLEIKLAGPLQNRFSASASETMVDGFAGVRVIRSFASNWTAVLRGDVGSGDSDITWNGQADLIYRFGRDEQFGAIAGYRFMQADYESSARGQEVDAEIEMKGPQIGFIFRF